MLLPRFLVWILSAGMMVAGSGIVSAQSYPSKPVRIVAAEPGGGADFASRLIAQGIAGPLGQPVIIDNRGGSASIAAQFVSKAPPDGYTLLLYGSNLWLLPFFQDNVSYDTVKDFSAITLAIRSPNILVVHPSLPVKSVKELIALAKARPGELNYASGSAGSSTQLAGELFKSMASVNIVRVAYKGGASALIDLVGGQVQLMFPNATAVTPHIKSGRLRALAVTSAQPSALVPGLPTAAASGLPGYESGATYGVFAPSGTPAAIINRLNQEIVRVLNQADVKERLFSTGVDAVGSSAEELTATVKSDIAKWGKVIKDAGIRPE